MLFKDLHEKYGHIKYIDHNHTYIDTKNNNKKLISVTQLRDKYREKFDTEYHSMRMSLKPKETRTQEQIKTDWKKDGILGAAKGTILHNYLENLWNNKLYQIDYSTIPQISSYDFIQFHDTVSKLIKMGEDYYNDSKNIIPVKTELIVGNDKVAGQIDLLAYDTEIDGYVIVDYKSDKRMNYKNFFKQNMLYELSHLDDCEINKYSLQLSFYKYLLKPVLDIKEMYIIWFNVKNDTYKKIKLKNLELETRTIFSSL